MLSKNLNIALIELPIEDGNKEANIKCLRNNFAKIPESTDLVVVPELFSTGFIGSSHSDALALAEKNTGDTIRLLQKLALEYNCAICGSFMARTADRIYNRGFFIEPSGEDTYYDKYHFFSLGSEDMIFSKGISAPKVIRYRGWNIMMVICYDLRFPVWCRNANNKYDLLIAVANWPKSRIHSWDNILTTRAIENQCYVCGVNRIGSDSSGIEYNGESKIIDFRGKMISTCSDNSSVAAASLNLSALNGYRESFPVWRDADDFDLK